MTSYGYVRLTTRDADPTEGLRERIQSVCSYADRHELDLGSVISLPTPEGVAPIESRERIGVDGLEVPTLFLHRDVAYRVWKSAVAGDVIILPSLTEAFLNAKDCQDILRRVYEDEVIVAVADLGADTSTPEGLMAVGCAALTFNWTSHAKSERIRESKRAARRAGKPKEHFLPPGYRWLGKYPNRTMAVCEKEFAIIRQIHRWHEDGMGVKPITGLLWRRGITVPHRSKEDAKLYGADYSVWRVCKCLEIAGRLVEHEREHGRPMVDPAAGDAWLADKLAKRPRRRLSLTPR